MHFVVRSRKGLTHDTSDFRLFSHQLPVDLLGAGELIVVQLCFVKRVDEFLIHIAFDRAKLPGKLLDLLDEDLAVVSDFLVQKFSLRVEVMLDARE